MEEDDEDGSGYHDASDASSLAWLQFLSRNPKPGVRPTAHITACMSSHHRLHQTLLRPRLIDSVLSSAIRITRFSRPELSTKLDTTRPICCPQCSGFCTAGSIWEHRGPSPAFSGTL